MPVEDIKPCSNWESWYETVTLVGLMLTSVSQPGGGVSVFETRLIDSANAEDVAQKLQLSGRTVSELSAQFRNMGAYITQQQPPGTGIRAKFVKRNFIPCR